jgi:hypothetical protein
VVVKGTARIGRCPIGRWVGRKAASLYRRAHELRVRPILCYTARWQPDRAQITLPSSAIDRRDRLTRSTCWATETLELDGHLSPADKDNAAYLLLPFPVPEGIARLEISYSFSDDKPGGFLQQPGNVLDIGLFDSRGSEFLSAKGFRGWSGSARRAFTLAADEATPGYLPGPILPGRWEILLGLVHILPQGCDYRLTIRLVGGAASRHEEVSPPPLPVVNERPGWYRGDLHCHTHHSDATGSLVDLATAARAQGLDFLAVTEHNTTSHLSHLPAHSGDGLLLLPGIEITTGRGHANAWGIERWHEFRCETPAQMAQVMADVRATGALISVNHPKEFGPPWTFGGEEAFDCLEVWQAPWFVFNDQSLALWDRLLRAGHRITGVGGSDVHQAPPGKEVEGLRVGRPCTWVYAETLSVSGLLAGIQAGHIFISEAPSGPKVFLTAETGGSQQQKAGMGDELRVQPGTKVHMSCTVAGARGCELRIHSAESSATVPIERDPYKYEWQVRIEADTFYRAEVHTDPASQDAGIRALSNPVYVRVG